MAIMNVTYKSYALRRYVDFKVILPIEDTTNFQVEPKGKPEKFKTIYLLHGYTGNCSDWLMSSRISKLARDRNLAIVMPSGENSFYEDDEKTGNLYGVFVGKELVEVTRKMFPLSTKKEDTIVAGLSMGGFGSLLLGSRFSQTFGSIICLSAGFLLDDILNETIKADEVRETKKQLLQLLGDESECSENSNKHPVYHVKKSIALNQMPSVYMACGTGDFLYDNACKTRDRLIELGAQVTWQEGEGEHTWIFWDEYIEKALDWLKNND